MFTSFYSKLLVANIVLSSTNLEFKLLNIKVKPWHLDCIVLKTVIEIVKKFNKQESLTQNCETNFI